MDSVFSSAANAPYTELGAATLQGALSFQGGSDLAGKAQILLRAAVAAILNAAHNEVSYGKTAADIIAEVNAALDSQDPEKILDLAGELDELNNAGCPLGGSRANRGDSGGTESTSSGNSNNGRGNKNGQEATTSSSTTSSLEAGSSLMLTGMSAPVVTSGDSLESSGVEEPSSTSTDESATEELEATATEGTTATGGTVTTTATSPAVFVSYVAASSIELNGALKDESGQPLTGVVGVTFTLYAQEAGGAPLWLETLNVELDADGRYSVSLVVPAELLDGRALWLGVQAQGQDEQPRVSLQ